MIDRDLVERRVSEISEALKYMREITSGGEEEFIRDLKSRLALRYLILLVVESAASIALHILSEAFGENAESYGEAFSRLAHHGVLSPSVAEKMASLARLRNLIVHRYWLVDDARIFREARGSGIQTVEKFVEEVVRYIGGS